jgi:Mannosyltransferase (PIG-V)
MDREPTRTAALHRVPALAVRDPERVAALRVAWRAAWVSRLLVWASGIAGLLVLGRAAGWRGFDPAGLTLPFSGLGDLLVAPAARWDATWYLAIASGGYHDAARTAFFPLYPLLVRVVGTPGAAVGDPRAAYLLAGIAISLAALPAGLYAVHRLTALELGPGEARTATWLVALFPAGFAFSAVYTESLFLALSAGAILAGRQGRWRWAGALGALAAATRSTGLLLVVPLALLYLRQRRVEGRRVRADLAWLALVPAGVLAFVAYLAFATGDPLAPFSAQGAWYRHFAGPFGGVWDGAIAAWAGVRQLASGSAEHVYFTAAGGDPIRVALHNVGDFAFLALAAVAVVGAFRRLPLAYGAWAVCAVALPLSYPVGPEPLASLPRYLAVVFPLQMWLAAWARERRVERLAMSASAALLVVLTAAFAAWEWVA